MNPAVDPLTTGIIPSATIPGSNADPKKRLMRCRLSGTTLATVDTNAPRMAIGSGQIKILRSWIYWVGASWDFRLTWFGQDLQIRVNGISQCQWLRENYYTQNDRFIQPISVKLFLKEGDVVTLYANNGSYNGGATWLSVFEENDERVS